MKKTVEFAAKTCYEAAAVDLRNGTIHAEVAGGVAEWLKAAVLKTVVPQGTGGSNPSSSANKVFTAKQTDPRGGGG